MAKKAQKVEDFNHESILQLLAVIPQLRWFDTNDRSKDNIWKADYLATMKLLGELLDRLCRPMQVADSPKRESIASEQAHALAYMLRHIVPYVSIEKAGDMSYIHGAIEHGCMALTRLIKKDL